MGDLSGVIGASFDPIVGLAAAEVPPNAGEEVDPTAFCSEDIGKASKADAEASAAAPPPPLLPDPTLIPTAGLLNKPAAAAFCASSKLSCTAAKFSPPLKRIASRALDGVGVGPVAALPLLGALGDKNPELAAGLAKGEAQMSLPLA